MMALIEAKLLSKQEHSILCYSMKIRGKKDVVLKLVEKLVALRKNGIDEDNLRAVYCLITEQDLGAVCLCYKLG